MHLVLTAVTAERSSPRSAGTRRTDGRTGVPSSDGLDPRVLSHSLAAHVYELCRCWCGWQGVYYSADARLTSSSFLPLSITWMEFPSRMVFPAESYNNLITTPEPRGLRQLRHSVE